MNRAKQRNRSSGRDDYHVKPYYSKYKLKAKPKVTLERAMRAAARQDMINSQSVHFISIKQRKPVTIKGEEYQRWLGRTETDENGHHHEITVFFKGDRLTKDTPVVYDCSCGRHAYTYEYANSTKGLSFIYRCNGDPAVQTNPNNKIGCCKHAIRVLGYILRTKGLPRK